MADKVILLHTTSAVEDAITNAAVTGTSFESGEVAMATAEGKEGLIIKNAAGGLATFPTTAQVNTSIQTAIDQAVGESGDIYNAIESAVTEALNDAKAYTDEKVSAVTVTAADGSMTVTPAASGTTIALKLDATEQGLSVSGNGLKSNFSLVKVGSPAAGMASQYKLVGKDGSTALGVTIDIAKDQFLKSAEFIASASEGDHTADDTVVVGDPYLKFTFQTTDVDKVVYVSVKSLVDVYTAGNGINVAGNAISIKLDPNSESYLTVGAEGLKLDGVEDMVDTKVAAAVSGITGDTSYVKKVTVNGVAAVVEDNHATVTIGANNVAMTGYAVATGATAIAPTDTISVAAGKLQKSINDLSTSSTSAIDAAKQELKNIMGVTGNTYEPNSGMTYINDADSIVDATEQLDAALKGVADQVAQGVLHNLTSTGNTVTITDGATGVKNLEVAIAALISATAGNRITENSGKLYVSNVIDCGTF